MPKTIEPIVNCHTHIFTADHVPPYLAKTILPSFIHRLINLRWLVAVFRFWYGEGGPSKWKYNPIVKKLNGIYYRIGMFISRTYVINLVYWVIGIWLFIQTTFLVLDNINHILSSNVNYLALRTFLIKHHLYIINASTFFKIGFALLLLWFFPTLRNLFLFLIKKLIKLLGVLPGKQTKEVLKRYLTIGRHAFHKEQVTIFKNLRYQYLEGTKFVVLPMDMEYMDAGKVVENYKRQMDSLIKLKNTKKYRNILYPFVFVDPRRIVADKTFFNYTINNGEITLDPSCRIKELIEDNKFSGFKIYPALGYYPFDKNLLALWKYAQQKDLPIMTHCIRGTIYYRGKKNKEWDTHPIFEQSISDQNYEPLLLPEVKNYDFCNNFTHPLNYLCLLDESLLIKVLKATEDAEIQDLFGYKAGCTTLTSNLKNLKICLAHFGGEDEWKRYFELDRDNYSTQILKNPSIGIHFLTNENGIPKKGKPEQIWKDCDWYSIICSLMLQYDNVYADISYISHDNNIHALLKRTIHPDNIKLRNRVLFGTDFYVVRNHKSEKQIMADTLGGLSPEEFDLIARENPKKYLLNKVS